MKTRSARLVAIIGSSLCVLCTGATLAQTAEPRAPELKVYTFSEITPGRYEVVSRQWGDAWRSAFWSPTFPTREQAVAALHTEAAGRGADALVNVYCLDQGRDRKWSSNTEPAILCYGIAVRVRPG